MKKNLVKLCLLLICGVVVLDLTGGTLAQPERHTPEQDAFIGFHLVPENLNTRGEEDRSHWEEYGSESLRVEGLGELELPREILVGVYDPQSHRYEFPGKEGFNCFLAIRTDENGERYINGYTDMMDNHVTLGDGENTLSGSLYVAPNTALRENDGIVTAYRVYQTKDGKVYLDGTGNSFCGPGFTISERVENTTTVNGERVVQATQVEFSMKDMPRLEKIRVMWFDSHGGLLGQEELDAQELTADRPLKAPEGYVWAVVEELGEKERAAARTVVEPDDAGRSAHRLILPDEQGIGRAVWLNW